MHDLIISYIRTGVPVLIGSIVSWALTLGIDIDADTQAATVTAGTGILIATYYAAARLIEARWPSLGGALLGVRAAPAYPGQGDHIATDNDPDDDRDPGLDDEPLPDDYAGEHVAETEDY